MRPLIRTSSIARSLWLALAFTLLACWPQDERKPWEPCEVDSCGEQCRQCSPYDRDCVETAVVKMCQADGSCSPRTPECGLENPCAAVLCPEGSQCVVLERFPPEARCVPIEDPCAAVRCEAGTHCEEGACVPDAPGVFCGGIAGIACPGAGSCEDDPSDSCDPMRGGADCGGRCVCDTIGLCVDGMQWNPSPEVCDCERTRPRPLCGDTSCDDGEYCCNESCGICAPLGGSCILIACD